MMVSIELTVLLTTTGAGVGVGAGAGVGVGAGLGVGAGVGVEAGLVVTSGVAVGVPTDVEVVPVATVVVDVMPAGLLAVLAVSTAVAIVPTADVKAFDIALPT